MTFESPLSTGIALLILSVLLLINILLILKSKNLHSTKARCTAFLLRLPVLLICAFVLFNPLDEEFVESRSINKVFLLDKSSSMALGDAKSRYKECLEILENSGVAENPNSQIIFFDSGLNRLKGDAADGQHSQLGKSLQQLLAEEKSIGDIVVLSDGAVHDKPQVSDALRNALSLRTRISTYVPKTKAVLRNVAIENCLVERQASPKTELSIVVELKTTNLAGKKVDIKLEDEEGNILVQQKVTLKEGNERFSMKFQTGIKTQAYKLSVSELYGEIRHSDNVFSFKVDIKKPTIRVLYMEGSSSTHFHAARRQSVPACVFMSEPMIKADDIEVDILLVDTQLERGGSLYNTKDKSRAFPTTREELLKYDVVICSDINRFIFSEDQLAWVRELVTERGGGFCMIGGTTSFGSGGWDKTVWEKMIPLDMSGYGPSSDSWQAFRTQFEEEQLNHPILQVVKDKALNKKILEESYLLLGTNRVKAAKPGATVLAWEANKYSKSKMPVIAVQQYGKGRSMAFTSDSAGGWGVKYQGSWGPARRNNQYYQAFWLNTIHWLAANSMGHRQQKLNISLDRFNVFSGDSLKLRVKNFDSKRGQQKSCIAYVKGQRDKALTLQQVLQSEDFAGELTIPLGQPIGETEIIVESLDKDGAVLSTDKRLIRLLKYDRELEEPESDLKYMRELSQATSGKVLNSKDDFRDLLAKKPEKVRKSALPIWDGWPLLLLVLLCLSGEWIFRKLHN